MKHKKALIIIASILFFLTAATVYLNRVVFPQMVKKIAIERLEDALKRKVEIGSIHFNWVKGFIINKIKVYEKGSGDTVFAQADQVSFGVLFLPGLRHIRVTIPFINVRSPSAHLVHLGQDTWNFSDIYSAPPAPVNTTTPAPAPAAPQKPSPFEIAWGGITISDGQFLIEDASKSPAWKEFFTNINLKLALSYKGINYNFTADIPAKNGFLQAAVYYQPLTHDTEARLQLRNIDAASYFSLANVPDVHLESGVIKNINLNIKYTRHETSAEGEVLMQNLDIKSKDQSFKGSVDIRGLDAQYRDGDITARGQMALSNIQTQVPGLSAAGSVEVRVNNFEFTKAGVNFTGAIKAQDLSIDLKDRRVRAGSAVLDNIRVRKDINGLQSVGSINTLGLSVMWPGTSLQGDLALKDLVMRMKNENYIQVEGQLQAGNFLARMGDQTLASNHIALDGFQLNILDKKNIALNTKLSLDEAAVEWSKNLKITGSLKTDKLLFNLDEGTVKVLTTLKASNGRVSLDNSKTIEASPQVELNLEMPLKDPRQMTYKGSVTLSDGAVRGFSPIQSLDHVELDVDFQNDAATINALNANVLDTNVHVTGSVKDFKDPFLNIIAEADDLNLAKIKDSAPQLVDQYGLTLEGSSEVKLHFEGLASKPLDGKILAVNTFKNVSCASSKLHQRLRNITGIIEATPNSLKWRDTTAVYQGQKYSLEGSLTDFKNPKITASLNGAGLELKGDLHKTGDLITVDALTGKYLNASFESHGTITLGQAQPKFNMNTSLNLSLPEMVNALPPAQKKNLQPLQLLGTVTLTAQVNGSGPDWKDYGVKATLTSPRIGLMGYGFNDARLDISQEDGKIKQMVLDGKLYDGTVHAVGSLDLSAKGMPYELALNIDNTDLHKLKMDSPLKMEEINGKFYLTTLAHGTVADFKNGLHATGSLAVRDGFLAEFNLFKGLLGILNEALRLGQVEITDVESNFTVENQKISTENLRLKGPTIVLLGKGWVNFDQICDLDITVDLTSGVVPAIAHDVLSSLDIRIYDKLSDPKFKKKISVPQVLNTLIKNLPNFLQLQ